MGERPKTAPPLAALSSLALSSGEAGNLTNLKWPPPGWPMFACITKDAGMALSSGAIASEHQLLQYRVSALPDGIYELEILSGRTGKAGTNLTPVIGIRFCGTEDWLDDRLQKTVLDIHIRGQRLIPEKGVILRVILAMTFIISRIDRGIAPSLKRVLKLYRLA